MNDEQVRRDFEDRFKRLNLRCHGGASDGYQDVHTNAVWIGYQAAHQSRQAEIDRLTLELAECKKDAERYRRLKNQSGELYIYDKSDQVVARIIGQFEGMSGVFDEFIDAISLSGDDF